MLEDGCFGDEIFLQLTCNVLNRDIVIIPAFKDQAHIAALGFTIRKSSTPNNKEPLFLFAFSESRFSSPHYQSIRPEDGRNIINEYIENNRDSLNSSRSTTLASFHQSSSESIFYPPLSSSSVGSSVSKFVVEGGRLVRSQDISSLMTGSPPPAQPHTLQGNESRWVKLFHIEFFLNYFFYKDMFESSKRESPIRLFRRQQQWASSGAAPPSRTQALPPPPPPGSRPPPPPGSRPSRPNGNVPRAVRAPTPADCTKKRCSHKIILGKHFCFAEWVNFVREEAEERACRPVADAGKCMVCHETVPGKRGWKAERSRHYHLFNECKEYPYSKINKQ